LQILTIAVSTVVGYKDKYAETGCIEDERQYNQRNSKLTDREQRLLLRIFSKNPKTSLR